MSEEKVTEVLEIVRKVFKKAGVRKYESPNTITHYVFFHSNANCDVSEKEIDGWLPENDNPVCVKVVSRYKHYKPQSQQAKSGIIGRWQLHNSFGWNNTDIEIIEYLPPTPEVKIHD